MPRILKTVLTEVHEDVNDLKKEDLNIHLDNGRIIIELHKDNSRDFNTSNGYMKLLYSNLMKKSNINKVLDIVNNS